MDDIRPMDPADAFARLGAIRFSETDLSGVLTTIAGLAKQTIPGVHEVSVTLVGGGGGHTAAFTGQLALTLDEWQYERGYGPCIAASAANLTVVVDDMAGENRWPDWAESALQAGAHSSISVGLPLHDDVSGALNVYAAKPHVFDEETTVLAQTFTGYAAVAMANAHLYDSTNTLAQHMRAVMESRAVVEQAKGIIMGERRCSADEAYAMLEKVAEGTSSTVRDAAAALVQRAMSTPKPHLREY